MISPSVFKIPEISKSEQLKSFTYVLSEVKISMTALLQSKLPLKSNLLLIVTAELISILPPLSIFILFCPFVKNVNPPASSAVIFAFIFIEITPPNPPQPPSP